jgi:hypothetical protein
MPKVWARLPTQKKFMATHEICVRQGTTVPVPLLSKESEGEGELEATYFVGTWRQEVRLTSF